MNNIISFTKGFFLIISEIYANTKWERTFQTPCTWESPCPCKRALRKRFDLALTVLNRIHKHVYFDLSYTS